MSSRTPLLEGQTTDDELSKKNSAASPFRHSKGTILVGSCIILLFAAGFFVYAVFSSSSSSSQGFPWATVTIAQGKLLGWETLAGNYNFNNIPFAQPPVGKLRWLPPQLPPPSWTGVRDALLPPNMCVQFSPIIDTSLPIGSEDCLYLNVYTRRIPGVNNTACTNNSNTTNCKLSPVLVFVHGGSSLTGWSAYPFYNHENLVANRDVVAVTVNYRLNVFGYLALDVLTENQYNVTGTRTSGNYGLLDNIAALKWVQANIAAFGGDPNRITLYGQSSGATNAVCLFMSPLARGLFHAVLSLSASPVLKGDLAFASQQNEPFLALSGCDNKASDQETLDCIYALSSSEALLAMPPRWYNSSDFGLVNFSWPDAAVIIVDDYVVPAEINTALSSGFGAEVVIEYGNMAQEIDLQPLEQPVGLNQTQFIDFLTELTFTLGWKATQTDEIIEIYPISDYQNDSMLTYETIVNDYLACGGIRNLNSTSTSRLPHTSPIFHHIIHYRPSVPTEYIGPGWPVSHAGHMWDLLLFLETYASIDIFYEATAVDRQNTETLRQFWVDQLATELTITDTAVWPEFNQAELSGIPNSTWTLELLEFDQEENPTRKFVATPNYRGDKCVLLREFGFASAGWAN